MQNIKRHCYGILTMSLLLVVAQPHAHAHHAFAAEFDANSPVKLVGEVVKVEWINPHAWIHIAVEDAQNNTQTWMIEGGTPNTLIRAGLNKHTVQPGTKVIVRGFQAKDKRCIPACKANGRDITLSNGEKLFMGSSGTGAPRDGSDPREPKRTLNQ